MPPTGRRTYKGARKPPAPAGRAPREPPRTGREVERLIPDIRKTEVRRGIVKTLLPHKNAGFIRPNGSRPGGDLFFDRRSLMAGQAMPEAGDCVSWQAVSDLGRGPHADGVALADDSPDLVEGDARGTCDDWPSPSYGFIRTERGATAFVHISDVKDGRALAPGEAVRFRLLRDGRGLRGRDVRREGDATRATVRAAVTATDTMRAAEVPVIPLTTGLIVTELDLAAEEKG